MFWTPSFCFTPGCHIHPSEDPLRWHRFSLYMSDIWAFLPCCHDLGEFLYPPSLQLLLTTQLSPFAVILNNFSIPTRNNPGTLYNHSCDISSFDYFVFCGFFPTHPILGRNRVRWSCSYPKNLLPVCWSM